MSEYAITLKARRFRWIPWIYISLRFIKETTYADAYEMAMQAAEAGAWDVRIEDVSPTERAEASA